MKRYLLIALVMFFGWLIWFPSRSFAIEDPLSLPNNKMGIHILFTSEINLAADLINSNGGDWGYVTIPIQAGDRDLEKWQNFMDSAKQHHVIPIVRLATEGDYFNTSVWRKPTEADVLDFANFLNSLIWPVKNKYVVIFNEVNRSDEWEGSLNPEEYAELLAYSVSAFKSLDEDFFIISSGLDNAAPNVPGKYMNEYDYMLAMDSTVPGIFGRVDGLGSHSYPNPGFRQMPYTLTNQSIYSFNFEKNLAYRLGGKNLPVFITETGWTKDALSESKIAECFKYAFENVWSDESVVAVTSFLLQAGTKPFSQFSMISDDGSKNEIYLALQKAVKMKGKPTVGSDVNSRSGTPSRNLPEKTFPQKAQYRNLSLEKVNAASDFLKWFLKLYI